MIIYSDNLCKRADPFTKTDKQLKVKCFRANIKIICEHKYISLVILHHHKHSHHILFTGCVAAFYWPRFSLAISCSDWIYLLGYDWVGPNHPFHPHPVAPPFPCYLPWLLKTPVCFHLAGLCHWKENWSILSWKCGVTARLNHWIKSSHSQSPLRQRWSIGNVLCLFTTNTLCMLRVRLS